MALVTRVSRLFRADLHAVLDRIEEPDVLLRQAVREMEEALGRDEQRLRIMIHEREQVEARRRDVEHTLGELEEELDVCFAAEKDDLARALIRRKLEGQRLLKHLARRGEALTETIDGLTTRIEENRSRLDAMRQKAELLTEEEPSARSEEPWSGPASPVREHEVEVAFLREKQRRARQ